MTSVSPALAATLLAAVATVYNIEEVQGGLTKPMRRFGWTAFAFRFAAAVIAGLFWILAAALWLGLPLTPVLTGFAAGMAFNAFVPHLALTVIYGRYNPGAATGLLLVFPSALYWLCSDELAAFAADRLFLLESAGSAVLLLAMLPFLQFAGRVAEGRTGGGGET